MNALPKRNRSASGYLPTLDGWRAIAVAMVCLSHSQQFTGAWSGFNFLHAYADFGVNLFFAISGILICSRLLDEESLTGTISLGGFYIRRAFRILPAAYLYLAVIAVLALTQTVPPDWHGLRSAVLLSRNYLAAPLGDTGLNRLTSHFWSLAIEEHFYLLFPFLLVFCSKHRKLLLGILLALSLGWLAVYVAITPAPMRSPLWERRSDLRLWCLLFPALLAVTLRQVPVRAWFVRFISPNLIYLALIAELVYRLIHLLRNHYSPPSSVPMHAALSINTPFQPFSSLILPLLMPFFVLATMLHPGTSVSRLLEWGPLRAVGRISYGIYLWQQLYFGTSVEHGWPIAAIPDPIRATFVVAAVLGSFFLMEKPLIRLGHRLAPPVTPGHRDLDVPDLTTQSQQRSPQPF